MSDEPRTVCMIGKTGNGKSTFGNILADRDEFPVGRGGRSVTKTCRSATEMFRGRLWTIVDTPGTRDVTDKDGALKELRKALNYCPDGIDAFLVIVRCDVRMTDDECKAIRDAVDTFGPECFRRAIVVFTHGDAFNNDVDEFQNELEEMRKEIPKLDELLTRFGNRWLLMDNGKSCDSEVRERQLSTLVSLVDSVAKHNSQRYSKSDLKSEKKQKKKVKALELEKRQLEQKVHAMQLQRMKDKLQAQRREQELLHQQQMRDMEARHERQQMQQQTQLAAERMCVQSAMQNIAAMHMVTSCHRGRQQEDPQQHFGFADAVASVGEGIAKVALSPVTGALKAIAGP